MPKKAKAILKDALAARDLAPDELPGVEAELAERLAELCRGRSSHPAVRRYIAHLAKEAPAMFSFLSDERVDATNWRAEQGIRPAVVNRKVWGGNRTERGARAQGTIMSVMRTATQHGVDAIEYLTFLARGPRPRSRRPARLTAKPSTAKDASPKLTTWRQPAPNTLNTYHNCSAALMATSMPLVDSGSSVHKRPLLLGSLTPGQGYLSSQLRSNDSAVGLRSLGGVQHLDTSI